VKAGEALFQIVDLDTVYVSAIVPEADFPRMHTLSGAELEVPGFETPQPLTRLVTIGRVVDAPSRTFPVIYEVNNRDRRVAVNQTVYVRVLFAASGGRPAIPESALVDDNGQPVVFVQQSGESFVRRTVKLGDRSGGYVQVLAGVDAGERIVTRGAHLIRLASMSNQVPAHGHVH
jgi:RND family efflux transporter MFP subunit